MTSKKPSRVEIIEKEIKRLNDRINKIGDTLQSLIGLTVEQNELASRLRFSAIISDSLSKDDVVKNIATFLEDEKTLVKRFKSQKSLEKIGLDGLKRRVPLYIVLVKMKDIAFDDFASLLIKKLGVDLAREVVPLDELTRNFGVESAEAWKKLFKK